MAARDDLIDILREFNLEGLIGLVDQAIKDDPTRFEGDFEFVKRNIMRTVKDTTEYKTRFKGLEFRASAGLPPISEDMYIKMEDDYRTALRLNGMPRGFYDTNDDFARFIGGNVDFQDLNSRLQEGYRAVTEADPGTKDELKRLYGLQDSDLAAFFLDPNRARTEVVRKAEAAQRAAAAREQQIQISAQQAEELVSRDITQREAAAGFRQIANESELYRPQMAGEDVIGQEEAIAAAFGTSAAAQQRIATRRRRRQAQFEEGGGFATGQTGVAGLRTASE